jgi:predicted acyltransferase
MLLVNAPGSWSAIYAPLKHAEWHGWTAADLIFPFFLFVVGVTTHISIAAARQRGSDERTILLKILRRGSIIVLVGLCVSAFPFFPLERVATMRIPGVLQRIGVTYVLAALITRRGSWRTHAVALVAILLGYWALLTLVPVPGLAEGASHLESASATLAAYVDRLLLGGNLWPVTGTWDPEGILSTIPAVASVIAGSLAARWIYGEGDSSLANRIRGLALSGAGAVVLGLLWGLVFPLNKNLWTSSYAVFAGGAAALALAGFIWLVDAKRSTWWTSPFVVFGLNPLVAFVGSMLMARSIYTLMKVQYQGVRVPVETAIYNEFFGSWLEPKNASLLFAITFLLFWLGVLAMLARRNVVVKV